MYYSYVEIEYVATGFSPARTDLALKLLSLKKISPLLSSGTWEYVESVLRRKKLIPYKPCVRGKHVESILGTRKNMTKKCIQFE
jgi:hypothetical protein